MGIRGFGNSLEQAFEQAALALMAVITDPDTIRAETPQEFTCEAPDDELLLVDWLNVLIYEMAVSKQLFSRFEVSVKAHRLTAHAWGETMEPARHQPAVEIKGATYTALRVAHEPNGQWLAQCVVDV
jgi:SHS2 domain-containing protein